MLKPNQSPPPARRYNVDVRTREYLLNDEVNRLIEHAGHAGRYGCRDRAMIMLAFGHGLRASELVGALWWHENIGLSATTINLKDGWIWIKRVKGSKSGQHDLRKCERTELRGMIKTMKGTNPTYEPVGSVFPSERDDAPITIWAFGKIVARAGDNDHARLGFPVHPHQLRHACGYHMLNVLKRDIVLVQEWLGHKNIRHTQEYAKVDQARLKGLWND